MTRTRRVQGLGAVGVVCGFIAVLPIFVAPDEAGWSIIRIALGLVAAGCMFAAAWVGRDETT